MVESINTFLDGMKTAFYTSVIGMFAGLVIKIFIQPKIDRSEKFYCRA
ncbi:MAG: hypothetical protein IJL14_07545 [Selenomonadaceae bacterium]|nr:hypothetical protein [Selenomonadaceae bacterium]MBQ6006086.1 hypothetical protein [Selenomonadaceae bacterium]